MQMDINNSGGGGDQYPRARNESADHDDENGGDRNSVVEGVEEGSLIGKLIKHVERDNRKLLQNIRDRIHRVGVQQPTIEVRYQNLCVGAECEVVHGKPLPTLWNSLKTDYYDFAKLLGFMSHRAELNIIDDVSGIIKPGRMTLLLGPPGCGKTSLLKALSGNLSQSLKVTGEVSYNGYKLEEFVPQKTCVYVSQYDQHIPEMTVRETFDFSACCQGVGSRADIMLEVNRREKEAGIVPDPDVDTYMKATSVKGLKETLQTDYILKILGLDICAETLVGDAMKRGISGGQKKRLTTGEMILGPAKALFLDEITNGLDMSTTFQIVACLQQLAHITDATVLVSLLQPSPETFDLFDDIILMAEGKTLYHGPSKSVPEFFESCGFRCPERKAVADFLQEVVSRKDQEQYWFDTELPYKYVNVDMFSRKFKESPLGKKLDQDLSEPYNKSKSHKHALSFSKYSLSRWELFSACMSRELLLMRRNSSIYIFKTVQIIFIAVLVMNVFRQTQKDVDVNQAIDYMGALFFTLVILLVDAVSELSMTAARLTVFNKQKELCFYPAWAYAVPTTILKVPFSIVESMIWTSLTYYVIGYSPEVWRFFRQFIILFAVHFSSISMFQFLASVFQTEIASMTAGSFAIILVLLFGGIIIPQSSIPVCLKWVYWLSPLTYGDIGVSVNEFLAPRWQKLLLTNTTLGKEILKIRELDFEDHFFWISLGALFGFAFIFNIAFVLALTFLKPPGTSRTMIASGELSNDQKIKDSCETEPVEAKSKSSQPNACKASRMVLPFEPLTLAFENLKYFVDTPSEMRRRGFAEEKLQLLSDITGVLRPGILTALMGVTGAGKTTLLDVLAGRKTSGYIEGKIKVGGYPKVQETFARISGYCEQTDVHSPQITVEESVVFSAWLRLSPQIDSKIKLEFVNEVLETIELDGIKDALVGIPGVSGLSTEQRKRLTIAVELVANPSIIFMDEPTTGLDARAAAIVMRAVKNVVNTGRTTVCTIHQPSIDIFEAFDELILLKNGGCIIYSGPLGRHSSNLIEYFEGISGVPKIGNNYNPATWVLEVTSTSAEDELEVDFAQIYKDSVLYEENIELARQLSTPPPGSKDLHFPTRFSQNGWSQFKCCLWKQHLSYWRSPSYNLIRSKTTLAASLLFGILFWNHGKKIKDQQDLFNIMGLLYASVTFLGLNNCSSILSYVSRERTVMYREKFAAMYSPWAYALAQVTIEVPYIYVQAAAYVVITYPMIGYYGSAFKFVWNFYGIFSAMLYFNYLGMFLVSLTPNFVAASILFSTFYTIFNLFAGFLMPLPQIPKWWVWLYYLSPTSWTLNAMLTSQYGDIETEISVFGLQTKTLANFLRDFFGYHQNELVMTAVVLIAFPLIFASLFAICIQRLNFQQR